MDLISCVVPVSAIKPIMSDLFFAFSAGFASEFAGTDAGPGTAHAAVHDGRLRPECLGSRGSAAYAAADADALHAPAGVLRTVIMMHIAWHTHYPTRYMTILFPHLPPST